MVLRVLQLGAIAVVLVATVHTSFDLDRFLVPKEVVLHLTALIAGALTMRTRSSRANSFLLGFLALSVISLLFATNHALALRAVAISVSAFVIYRASRTVPAEPLLNALALAVVLACVTALLQTYGVWLPVFSENRAPGGTLGNRNFIGHMAAFGLPLVMLAGLRGSKLAPFGIATVAAALVLTRSRAAWLAAACVLAVFLVGMLWRARMWKKLAVLTLFATGGAAAAMIIPNTLRWRSDNPYLESAKSVTNYERGSGRGRLVQYQQSLRMALANPLFGAGPGNWPVAYPEFAARSDPSLDNNEEGMTTNPWPSSDWIAYVSERGIIATVLLAIALVLIAFQRSEDPLVDIARFATLAGAGATGALDAVLLLAAPAFIVWAALGALSSRVIPRDSAGSPAAHEEGDSAPRRGMTPVFAILLLITLLGTIRSTMQLTAMEVSKSNLTAAARIDPWNYRFRLRLAHRGKRAARCEHARAAHALFPHAEEARRLANACD